MANNYNTNPIILTATMASGWKSLQTLNTGTLPANAQQTSGTILAQPGIQVVKIQWTGMTAAGHTFSIIDPVDSVVKWSGVAGSTLTDQEYDFEASPLKWKDFKLSQISSGTLSILYRI